MSANSNIYSQGFNFSSFIQKGVDPRTGQYTCTIDLYEAPSHVRNCPLFKLTLTFNPLNKQDIGLGQGWSFNLPCYEHRQSKPTVALSTGESYRITETSSNIFVNDQKLKSSQIMKGETGFYQVTYKSGQVEILSNANNSYNKAVLVELYSHVGRSLSFKWVRSGEQPRLEKILQGTDVLLEIKYEASQTVITRAPTTSEACVFTLIQKNNQLTELRLPLAGSPAWNFVYEKFGQVGYLQHITSPSGLVEEVQYKEQGHRLPTGAPFQSIPYAISHTARPGVGQPPIVTKYSYSDHNFLGYNGNHNWKDGEDNLFLSPYDYQYTSTVAIVGGTTTKHTYNKFHLLVASEQQKGIKKVIETTTYHALPNKGFEDQPAQYQLPKTVEKVYEDATDKTSRKETSHHVFDEWGNPTLDIQPNGIKTDRTYYPPAGEKGSGSVVNCPADPHGFQRYIKTETITPAASSHSAPTRSESYTYAQVPTATGAKAAYFVAVQKRQTLEASRVLTASDCTYVSQPTTKDHGRLQQEVTSLLGDFPTTKNWTYAYPDNNQLMQTVTTKSFDNSTVKEETGYSMWSGLTLSNKDEGGITEHLSYDTIGRFGKVITSQGTPYETVLQHSYTILGGSNGSQKTVTDAKGVQTRYTADGLNRVCRVERHDVDRTTFRVIQENSYNAQGQQIVTKDIDWLRSEGGKEPTKQESCKTMTFDDWGNVGKVTESTGLVILSAVDPITLKKTEGIESEGTVKSQLNDFGDPTEIALHKSDNPSTLYSKVTYTYDGLGRLVTQRDHLGRTTTYLYDSFDRISQITWPSDRVVKTEYASHTTAAMPTSIKLGISVIGEQSFDGLGRLIKKKVGARTTHQSYEGILPEPSEITSSKGDKFNLDYAPALNYATIALNSSNNTDNYQYDAKTGAISQSKGPYSTHDLHYLPTGPLSQETIKITGGQTFSSSYTYSMAGKLQEYTDVHGKKQQISYDAFGRPQKFVQGNVTVFLVYDKANRVSEETVEDEEKHTKLISTLTYDDFGREIKRSVKKGDNSLVYNLTLTYNNLGLITNRLQEKGQDKLRDETFEYDAHNRLIKYGCQGSKPPLDNRGKLLKKQDFTFDRYDNISQCVTEFQDGTKNTAVHSFSTQEPTQLTQITNTHPDLSPKVEIKYDANGCLTQDDQGRKLEYDSMNRLTVVRDAHNKLLAQYLYDATGKLVCQQVPDQPDTFLFYRGDSLIAVQKGDRKTSYLSNGTECWGETNSVGSGEWTATETNLWALDSQNSVLATIDTQQFDKTHHQQYTPYCSSDIDRTSSSLGFNGQWKDPVTGWYHLGNGYRVYNPVLMRFHTPDPWSPFTSGEINPYAYCLGDPINRVDPSGHFSLFGIKFGWKDLIMAVVGIAVSVAVGVLTGGASLAIQIGVGLAVGVATDVVSGIIGDAIEGNPITWKSVGMDVLGGLVGGIAGTAGGQALKSGFKALKAAPMAAAKALGRAGSYSITRPMEGALRKIVRTSITSGIASGLRGAARGFIPSQVVARGVAYAITKSQESGESQSQKDPHASLSSAGAGGAPNNPLGRHGPAQVGSQRFYLERESSKARDLVRPVMKDGDVVLAGGIMPTRDSMPMSSYGSEAGLGQSAVAHMLNRDVRFFFVAPLIVEKSEE
ncbi:YD repeat-containing protein [Metarhizium guizhouense ARSEF 977]|uniref:YD repeat-containing protein n=1 Tax=Metarhizium guizhouense (strain ARSEF 977) TaxID=1276136 RepID=A0A0B4G3G8_METGA|nr:YD repeat-containing protein [Metarhizium guizhouense ARSEF 977]